MLLSFFSLSLARAPASFWRARRSYLLAALTHQCADAKPNSMQQRTVKSATYGPWLVGLGAALWGTESAWRIPLNELFDAKVIVFWEHVFILIMFLPILISRLDEIPRVRARTWGFLIFSGFAGSAVGTVFFTLALKYGNPTVVNVVLNIQPIISTLGAFLLFGDRLARQFFLYAGIGLVCMTLILLAYGKLNGAALWPEAAQAHPIKAIVLLFFLASISGGIPLLIYFQGLHLTRASTAGYFEMMQTLAAVCITWGFFHASLYPHQVVAALVLIAAVAMVHHVQLQVEAHN